MSNQPPKMASWLLQRIAGKAEIVDIQGDLEEQYGLDLQEKGRLKAQLAYWKNVLSIIFSYALKRRKAAAAYSPYYGSNTMSMVQNYVKISIRSFLKNKLFTSINIVGLALGMSLCLLALSISVSILESDGFHAKKDRIYQINTHITDEEGDNTYGSVYPAAGHYLEEKYPFVETALTIHSGFSTTINHHGNRVDMQGYYADPEFFEVFSFQLTKGNPRTALSRPGTIVLTESVAEKLFRDSDPIGKVLETENGNFTVTGVMPDLKKTHLYFDVLTSTLTYEQSQTANHHQTDWQEYRNHYLYVMLRPESDPAALELALAQTSTKIAEMNEGQTSIALESVLLDEAVPRWDISNALGIGWDYPSMLFFMFIGLLILLPAIFNYTNLSIARAMKRAKEIGVRKVVGAEKRQIQLQFIVETVIMVLLALLGATALFVPMQTEFLDMVVSAEVLDTSLRFSNLLAFLIFGLIIGVVSGLFPALYFSRLSPVHTLKGDLQQKAVSVSGIKKGLFIFQFGLSLFFIIGVATIARQYQHVFSHAHGFDSEQVLTIPFYDQNKQVALQELARHPDVKNITTTSHLPGIPISYLAEVTQNGADTLPIASVYIGDDFVENMKMDMVWGNPKNLLLSNLNEEMVLVNEEFLKSFAVFPRTADSLAFTFEDGRHARIAGVIKDLHYEPLNEQIKPMVMRYSVEESNYVLIHLQSSDIQNTLSGLQLIWSEIDQQQPFDAAFLDDEIQRAYKFLTVQIKIFSFLGTLAIIISCLGLLGMVSYTTENRTKEIAIRKIMGASASGIYLLLTKDYIKLIGYSALLAIPLSWLFYDQIFLYFLIRYGLGLGVLEVVGSVFFLFSVGFLFIYWQTSKVVRMNPATNLRYE